MSETRCHTPARGRTSQRASTCTEPGVADRPRSLRIRSTIMTFSARSLADAANRRRARSSACGSGDRGAVPLIGEVCTRSSAVRRNSSGDRLATAPHGPAR